jgi:TonB family protein
MPQAEETRIVVELTHHSLHALRAAKGTIEAGGECMLQNKAAVEAVLSAVAPGWKDGGLRGDAFIWPDTAGWRVSTDTEAMLDRTGDAMSAIAGADLGGAGIQFAYAACGAADGGPVTPDGIDKWVMAYSPAGSLERVSEELANLKIESDGAGPAAFAHISAVSAALRQAGSGAVALWDIGSDRSSVILVTAGGVEGSAPCSVGLESVFGAVQTALRLKFRGAGERLFFNDAYDFTEPGPKVAAIIGPALKEALGALPQLEAPPALACIGLTGKQAWFVRDVGAAAGVSPWENPLGKLAGELGINFADDTVEASFSLASAGLLGLLAGRLRGGEAWQPAWAEAQAPEEVPEPEPAPVEEPEPVAPPAPVVRPSAPAPRAKPALTVEPGTAAAPASSKPTRPPSVPNPVAPAPGAGPKVSFSSPGARPPVPQSAPAPAPKFSAPPPQFAPPPSSPAPQYSEPPQYAAPPSAPSPEYSEPPQYAAPPSASPPQFSAPPPSGSRPPPVKMAPFGAPPQRPPSFSNPGFSVPEPGDEGPALPPPPAPPAAPTIAAGLPKVALTAGGAPKTAVTALPFEAGKAKPAAAAPSERPPAAPRNRTMFFVGVAVAATVMFAVIMYILKERRDRADALYQEQQEELAHHVAEDKLKAEEKAAADAAEVARVEMQKEIEITRKQTEDETRRNVLAEVEAERQSKLPGTLVVATSPSGASVSIDGGAPITSPVRQDGVAPGTHKVQISLAGHATVYMNADIQGSKTDDLGTVVLESVIGTLQVSSIPDGLEFYVRPVSDPSGKPVKSGRAPASFADIPFGDYLVTFTRPECRDHVEKATVTKNGVSSVTTTYQDGSLELSSDPSGAWVTKDGSQLGTTPLVLHDLTPKKALFELTLPGYDPTPVTVEIPEGDTAKVSAQLLRKDRVFNPDEVKTPPTAYVSPQPQLSESQRKLGAEVLLSLVVDSGGVVRDVEVVKATDDDIARRCQEAVERWKYHPATAPDDRAVDAKIEVPFSFPAAGS